MNWGNIIVESKAFRIFIKGTFWASILIALLILIMIINFIIKIVFLDYRFDDGELRPPIEAKNNELS